MEESTIQFGVLQLVLDSLESAKGKLEAFGPTGLERAGAPFLAVRIRRVWPWFSYASPEWMPSMGSFCIHMVVLVAELLSDCPRCPRSHTPCRLAPVEAKEWVYRERTSSHSSGKISEVTDHLWHLNGSKVRNYTPSLPLLIWILIRKLTKWHY